MRRFNPEKELNKIQKGNKNKIILFVISLLVLGVIGYSFAIYQIRYNKRIIYTTVAPFYSKDLQLAVYVDDIKQDKFPDKETYYFDKVICDNNSEWEFDYDNWKLMLKTDHQDKCNIYFTKNYRDRSGANAPELYQGLIPIYFNDGKIYIADVEKEWYDYDKHNWGNAVLIDYASKKDIFYDENNKLRVDTQIQEDDILQMYVWIPRYKYKIFNESDFNTPKQIIDIKFEAGKTTTGNVTCSYEIGAGVVTENCTNLEKGNWYTHPAFTFGQNELEGFWVGKFEPSDAEDAIGRNLNNIQDMTILPNKTSMVNKSISTSFYAEQKLSEEGNKYNLECSEVDTRMMKNIEWGAVAYLTQSIYGIYNYNGVREKCYTEECEVWINNTSQGTGEDSFRGGGTYTGCVAAKVNDFIQWNTDGNTPAKCDADKRWNTGGVKASTTGNMYGIYDMAGGVWENVMGVVLEESSLNIHLGGSGFKINDEPKLPDNKYYDIYTFDTSKTTMERGHYGDATKELLENYGIENGAWTSDRSYFIILGAPWFMRGSKQDNFVGLLTTDAWWGYESLTNSFRSVLSAA